MKEIVGAFSAIVWDRRKEKMFLMRDKTGIRHLYYSENDNLIASNHIGKLLSSETVEHKPNKKVVAEHLIGDPVKRSETFYKGVMSVRNGSVVKIDENISRKKYWRPGNRSEQLDKMNEKELVQELRSLLERAVRDRMRSSKSSKIGVMMSGGKDSTSLAYIADKIEDISVCSITFPELPDMDESNMINTVASDLDGEFYEFDGSEKWALKQIDPYREAAVCGPRFDSNVFLNKDFYNYCSKNNLDILVTGMGGNLLDGTRIKYWDLLRSGKLGTLAREIFMDPVNSEKILYWYILKPLASSILKRELEIPAWISEKTTEKIKRNHEERRYAPSLQVEYRNYFGPHRFLSLDAENILADNFNIEFREPFYDSRLVDFIFSLPVGYRMRKGEKKYLFKKSMRGLVPDKIIEQEKDTSLDPLTEKGFREKEKSQLKTLLLDNPELIKRSYVKPEKFRSYVRSYLEEKNGETQKFWKVVATEIWLRTIENRSME